MREILFRGKQEANSECDTYEWITGYLDYLYIMEEFTIRDSDMHILNIVIPETVGQYTGLTDKNGKKIFEGDIIIINDYVTGSEYDGRAFIVKYLECGFWAEPIGHSELSIPLYNECAEYEVIGNIY